MDETSRFEGRSPSQLRVPSSPIGTIVLCADIKPIVDGEAARCAASPSISVLTYLRIAIDTLELTLVVKIANCIFDHTLMLVPRAEEAMLRPSPKRELDCYPFERPRC